jgi:hypothetical protein
MKKIIFAVSSVALWHGAANKSSFTHIAITNLKNGNNVIWLKPVTDKEYSETNR